MDEKNYIVRLGGRYKAFIEQSREKRSIRKTVEAALEELMDAESWIYNEPVAEAKDTKEVITNGQAKEQ